LIDTVISDTVDVIDDSEYWCVLWTVSRTM